MEGWDDLSVMGEGVGVGGVCVWWDGLEYTGGESNLFKWMNTM